MYWLISICAARSLSCNDATSSALADMVDSLRAPSRSSCTYTSREHHLAEVTKVMVAHGDATGLSIRSTKAIPGLDAGTPNEHRHLLTNILQEVCITGKVDYHPL